MGFFRTAIKGAVAGKVIKEAKKPQNQAKAKQLFNKLRGKDTTPTAKGTRRGTTAGKAGKTRTTR